MNAEYIQNLRYKLQKRVRRLNSTEYQVFHFSLKQFWGFLKNHPIFVGILEDLERRSPSSEADAEKIIIESQGRVADNELENAAISYFVVKKCVESDNPMVEVNVGFTYHEGKHNDSLEYFKSLFLEPLYEYLDEQLDDQGATLALLRRYKHKCEWFQRKHLFNLWKDDTTRGEKHLALHLYEYLHDQGLDFMIEPSSISGEVDLIAAQKSDDPLIADAKIFNPEKGKGSEYIAKGFNQVYLYTLDYNEPFGYLIIYKTSGEDLRFALANQAQSTPFVVHNNKTIFMVTIDIFPYESSASKRGPLKTLEITEEDLIRFIKEK
ncbi:hypothetical protein ES702_01058 [subsurface metagenome]